MFKNSQLSDELALYMENVLSNKQNNDIVKTSLQNELKEVINYFDENPEITKILNHIMNKVSK